MAGDLAALRPYVPAGALALYEEDAAAGAVLDEQAFSLSLLTALRLGDTAAFARLPGAGGEGLANLLARAAAEATSAAGLYALLKSKRYAHARLRRLALAA